jgi:hypothetical protein
MTKTDQIAQTIASLAGTATGYADGAARYAAVIKADEPDQMPDLLARFFEAQSQLQDVADALRRLAPKSARAGDERAARVREGLTI